MPQNYAAKTYFLEGLQDINNNCTERGLFKLQKAYHLAVKNRELLTEGLIARELAYFYEKEGMESQQDFFFKLAIIHFDNYKAKKLSKKIIDKYPKYSIVQKAGLNVSQKINLQSFISASTSIAAEIKLEALLEKMMVILAENAGAEKVLFIVPTVHNFEIIASKNKESLIIDSKSIANESHVPLSILNYVKRTHKHVLIQAASKDSRHLSDPYIRNNEILSVLCIPVIKNLQLLGVLYFENNLIKSAFSEENTESLKLLAAQIAISFENSQLYKHMEKKIEERTQKLNESLNTLRTTQKQLIQNEKLASLGELTAGIAHEIQNPLNFVNNFSEVSSELVDELEEELEKGDIVEVKVISNYLKENLQKINHHGQRASSIVKGMLEHSRSSSGKKELTDINALADEYLRLAYHGLRAKDKGFNADFSTELDSNLPQVEVVSQDIGRVLLNLINNAFQAVQEEAERREVLRRSSVSDRDLNYKPAVSITTTLTANSQLLVAIKDNGSGIPDEIKNKIFQPFFTTKETGKGTGLGLSLAYDIVKVHGGTIEVNSSTGNGTEFVVILPTS
jgi:signal transduction histidine kinase